MFSSSKSRGSHEHFSGYSSLLSLFTKPSSFFFLSAVFITIFTWQLYAVYILIIARGIVGNNNADTADALVMFVFFAPMLLFIPITGYVVDRFSRKQVLIMSRFCSAAMVLVFLVPFARANLWSLLVLHFFMSVATVFFVVARNSLIPNIYDKNHLLYANIAANVMRGLALATGSLSAGFLANRIAHDQMFFICACLHTLAGITFMQVRVCVPTTDSKRAVEHGSPTSLFKASMRGLNYLKQDRYLFVLILCRIVMNAVSGLQVLYMAVAEQVLGLGSFGLGLFAALRGIGFALGAFVATYLKSLASTQQRIRLTIGLSLVGVGFVVLGLLNDRSPWLSGAVVALIFGAVACVNVVSITLIHRVGRNAFLGRVLSVDTGLGALMQMTVSLLLGLVLGPHTVIVTSIASGLLLTIAAVAWSRLAAATFSTHSNA
ncbi:MAG: MFS transporter [Myxococcota bacterium]